MVNDILKWQHKVAQRGNKLAEDLIKELEASRANITAKIVELEQKYLDGGYTEVVWNRKKAFLQYQRAEVEKAIAEVFQKIKGRVQDAGNDTIKGTSTATIQTLNKSLGTAHHFFKLDVEAVQSWFTSSTVDGLLVNEWLKKLETSTVDRIVSSSRRALVEGQGLGGMIRRLRDDGFQGSRQGLVGLSRTMLMSASNFAREQTITQGFSDVIDSWVYCSTLDSRTCISCGSLDGTIYKFNQDKPALPLHWNCRCCYIPQPKALYEGEHVMETSRPAEGGRFTGSYNEWMQSQLDSDPEFVRDVLGPGRFELFSKGKITLSSMTDVSGRVKSLSELVG